jgi:hypothetical protein
LGFSGKPEVNAAREPFCGECAQPFHGGGVWRYNSKIDKRLCGRGGWFRLRGSLDQQRTNETPPRRCESVALGRRVAVSGRWI